MAKIIVDDSDYRSSIKKYCQQISEELRIAMLESMQLVALKSVGEFMVAHTVSPGEYGRPGGERVIGKRRGGSKLGILTSRLARSILDQESSYGREGIRRISIRLNAIVGELGSKVPYARIHEKGGTIHHTNLFGRGIKADIDIPARPYLEPAVKSSQESIRSIFDQRISQFTKRIF